MRLKEMRKRKLEDDPLCFAPPFISAEKKFEPMPPKIQKTSFVKEIDAHGKTWEDLNETTYPWTIVEDFDGTLCKGAWPEIGEPNWEEIAYILKRQREGAKVILSTCREGDKLDAAVAWCADKGIIFDAVNENLQEHCAKFGGDSRKIYGDEYRDDKAVMVTFGEKRTYAYREKTSGEKVLVHQIDIARPLPEWSGPCVVFNLKDNADGRVDIRTLYGSTCIFPGDWLVYRPSDKTFGGYSDGGFRHFFEKVEEEPK